MAERKLHYGNIFVIWFQAVFYSVIITLVFAAFQPGTVSVGQLIKACLPITSKQWWYLSCYTLLFVFIPILNAAVTVLSKEQFSFILICILFGVTAMSQMPTIDAFSIREGYSPWWLMIMYLVGAYIKKYNPFPKIKGYDAIGLYFLMALFILMSKLRITFITQRIFGQVIYPDFFFEYTSLLVVLSSVCLFFFLQELERYLN